MKRVASLSILFAALIVFAIERAGFDLWIVAVVAIVTLLWNCRGTSTSLSYGLAEPDHNAFTSGDDCHVDECLSTRSLRTAPLRAGFDRVFGEG